MSTEPSEQVDYQLLEKFDRNDLSKSQISFSEEESRVFIDSHGSVSITNIKSGLTPENFTNFKEMLLMVERRRHLSAMTLANNIGAFDRSFSIYSTKEITIEWLSHIRERIRGSRLSPSIYNFTISLIKAWHSLGLEGITDEVIDFLSDIRPLPPKRKAGSRVRSNDPNEGWYTDLEYYSLVDAHWKDYEENNVTFQETLAKLLSAQYGRRPIQLAQLKICDIQHLGESFGVTGKRIIFPGAKGRDADNTFRELKVEVHPIGEDLWRLCQIQIEYSQKNWEKYFGNAIPNPQNLQLPLFQPRTVRSAKEKIQLAKKHLKPNESIYQSKYLHRASRTLSKYISGKNSKKTTTAISERTGEPVKENAYRYRYTRARQLARLGVPRATLSHWLGHESSKSLDAYYDDPAENARKLDKHMAPMLAPLAQAFQGQVIWSESQAIRGSDPSSRVELDGKTAVGNCGEHGFCAASVPIPCYRCTKFQPWVDGPHEEVLHRLLERQEIENSAPTVGSGRRLIVPLQLDRDIEAVRDVIFICNQKKIEWSRNG